MKRVGAKRGQGGRGLVQPIHPVYLLNAEEHLQIRIQEGIHGDQNIAEVYGHFCENR